MLLHFSFPLLAVSVGLLTLPVTFQPHAGVNNDRQEQQDHQPSDKPEPQLVVCRCQAKAEPRGFACTFECLMMGVDSELDTFCVKQQPASTEQKKHAQCYPGQHVLINKPGCNSRASLCDMQILSRTLEFGGRGQ